MIKLSLLNCGKHYGMDPEKPCSKCAYYKATNYEAKVRKATQYSGRPWVDVIGEVVK